MTRLARKLRVVDYFTLGWGTMVGVGWLVVMDDWLGRGGPLGAVLGFAIGGALLLPVGYVYGQLVAAMPDAAGEIAYTAKVFPQTVSYGTGWMMFLAYFIVCPWEAVALGRIAAFIFPRLDSFEIYRVAGQPVYLPHLALGLGLTALLTILNYRGIRLSASFQNWTTFAVLALFVIFVSLGAAHGTPRNFPPLFSHTPWISLLLVLQIVPYFMTGFESVAKSAEEASPEFQGGGFFLAIVLAIVIGALFYIVVIAAVAWASPWQALPSGAFSTAVAFERALHARWIVGLILSAALLSLFKVFNGNFVAASRLLFALGRRGLLQRRLGEIHARNQTPAVAVVLVGIATAAVMLAGEAILVPITEVGSVASALGWLAACASYYRMRPLPRRRAVAVAGVLVAAGMVLMKALPFVPGHFSAYEWMAFAGWVAAGWLLRSRPAPSGRAASGSET
jgi:amino acid transporter